MSTKYKKEDFKPVTWPEYATTLEKLFDKISVYIKDHDITIDAVVPIMRGGAIPGTYLAYKLHILAILPVQYKYFFENGKTVLKRLTDYPKHQFKLPEKPTMLLVEGNHCFGNTAEVAVEDLLDSFPSCRIIYAADHKDASIQNINGVEMEFWGKLTDETRSLSGEEASRLGVERGVSYLFPWENIEEELATVQNMEFEYCGGKADGEVKKVLNLEDEKS